MTLLFDPENRETMVYCDSPDNCNVHCSLGFREQAGFFFMRWLDGKYDFCSADCMLLWILEVPPLELEDYEDDEDV